MAQEEHIGKTALDAERTKLLQDYDAAVAQAADDPVKVEHGVSCDAHFRSFLEQFLPKKYGVTKGHIITSDLKALAAAHAIKRGLSAVKFEIDKTYCWH